MRHLYFSIIILFFFTQNIFAQQYPQFSNYIVNQYAFNPAIPNHGGYVSGNFVYRNQWVGLEDAPVTMVAGLRFGLKKIPIGFGVYVHKDQAGLLQNKLGSINLSYTQKLNEKASLTLGASGQMMALDVDSDLNLTNLSDQLFADAQGGQVSPDLNVGLMFEYDQFFLGLSVPQFLQNELDFSQTTDQKGLLAHYFLVTGYTIQLNDKMSLEPSTLVQYVADSPIQVNGGLRLFFDKFWIGGTYRHLDAAAALIGFKVKNFDIAYGYDLNISNLKSTNSGSHEISIGFRFGGKKDSDEDGIADEDDKCPDEPGTKDTDGCPEEEEALAKADFTDTDKDGIPNSKDKCPTIAGLAELQGCPVGDRDKDGVKDDVDKCPDLTGTALNGGCPNDDKDKDGIVDDFDKCPEIPGTILGSGCPEEDADNDGIVDALDNCPNEAGAKTNAGCPVSQMSPIQPEGYAENGASGFSAESGISIRNVYFDTDKDDIRKEHRKELDELANFLFKNPNVRVGMSGHTDERATNEYNDELSKRRAEAVMFYLINRGVKRNQIVADYYGEIDPAVKRHDELGWQMNRRVELTLIFR